MPDHEKRFTIALTGIDRVAVRIKRNGGKVVDFSVQYDALINGGWRKICRFDGAHNEPHQHIFYPDDTERRRIFPYQPMSKALTEALAIIKRTSAQMRENYQAMMRRPK